MKLTGLENADPLGPSQAVALAGLEEIRVAFFVPFQNLRQIPLLLEVVLLARHPSGVADHGSLCRGFSVQENQIPATSLTSIKLKLWLKKTPILYNYNVRRKSRNLITDTFSE